MSVVERDRQVYQLAQDFLPSLSIEGVTRELVDKYLCLPETTPPPTTMEGIYESLLFSAQNANMKAGVIGGAVGGVDKLAVVLFDFDPQAVVKHYQDDWERVLDAIEDSLKPRGQIRRTARSIWPRYCKTILSAADFMAQFTTADDFYGWAHFFIQDDRARPALPMLLSAEVYGIGFPLACDFLKELGYLDFAKPDVHLWDIFTSLNLCPEKASDYQLFKAIVRVAKNVGATPYNVDKLFWLIGSGDFYYDEDIGVKGRTGSHKAEFIAHVSSVSRLHEGEADGRELS